MTQFQTPTLLIDAGNTRLKWALYQAGELVELDGMVHQNVDLDSELQQRWVKFTTVDRQPLQIVIANVAGQKITEAIRHWYGQVMGTTNTSERVIEISPQAKAFGVTNAYAEPAKLGVDRWAGLIAARHYIQGACCIVDCGTAITVDILSSEGIHQGGIILPGITMMKHSLSKNTHGIYNVESRANHYLGTDTASGVQAGAIAAGSGAINQIMQHVQQTVQEPLTGIITGGDAQQLLPRLQSDFHYDPQWIIKGLGVIAGCLP